MPAKRFFYLLALFCLAVSAEAQTEETSASEVLENYFRENEQSSESDIQEFLEYLEILRDRPLDLNRAEREELSNMHLINELQIENLLAYRERFGPLLNEYELQAVPGWEIADIRRVLPFVRTGGNLEQRFVPAWKGFVAGENNFLLRWGQSSPVRYTERAEGGPDALAMRFRHNFDNRLRFGFTAEKDPGEAFFAKSNRAGFDFYSAHLTLNNPSGWLKTATLGDFSARFGQGLLLQSGFALGKTAETTAIIRGGAKIRPYASFGEAFFLRGGAATVRLTKNWEITALYSSRQRDATTDTLDAELSEELFFSSLQSSGLHREPGEVAREKTLQEQVAGVSGTFQWHDGHLSVNGLQVRYDKPWQPAPAAYRRYAFAGDKLTGASVDYAWHRRNFYFFGETARSDNGAVATTNGLLLGVDRRVTLSALHRRLPADYQALFAVPFAETTGGANEHGLFVGADVRPSRPWQINVYADLWRHPWLRFGADAPSRGREYLARVMWTRRRVMSAYVYWKLEAKERNSALESGEGLAEHRKEQLRLHAQYRVSPGVELRSRIEWTTYQIDNQPRTRGYLAYEEAVFRKLGFPVYGVLRYAIFDTDDYNSRVYAFENDLFSAFSVPAFSGRGSRWYVNLHWRINDACWLEGRFEQTLQRKTATDGTAVGPRNGLKLQARVEF